MKKVLLFVVTVICLLPTVHAQVSCNATSFDVDLSASIDTTVSFQSRRNGDCCTGNNCIRFNLKLNPACSYVNFSVANPAPPGNSAYYQIDCGTPASLGTPICIVGKTEAVITFCKPGNDNPTYTITAAGALKGSDDITVREGCSSTMSVAGLQTSTISWTSIYPGAEGAYNGWLNCLSGCPSVNVIPQTGAPAYVDFKVSGYRLCGPLVSDTIRVYTKPQIAVSIDPANPSVCADGSTYTRLTATASGGDEPYEFVWNTGGTGPSISVNTGTTYSVSVTDGRNCLPAVQSVPVKTNALPPTPVITTNSPVCEGSDLQLFIPAVAGASYRWTGPNGFISTDQNPVIHNASVAQAGSYLVTVTIGQCSGLPATTTVVINPIPIFPLVNSNSPVCEGASVNLTATNLSGASYTWAGPNGFSSNLQNPSILSAGTANSGTYYLTATVNGCNSVPSQLDVTVNALPLPPFVSSNSPVCEGGALSINTEAINGASFTWSGPNGFSSTGKDVLMNSARVSATGNYSVKATVNGCSGAPASIAVLVKPVPLPPVLSSNQPVCEGSDLTLAALPVSGGVFTWAGPSGFSSMQQYPVITSAPTSSAGVYSAFVTVNGCNSSIGTTAVTIKPVPATPTISGSTQICEGDALSLSASTVSSASYQWTGPNGFASTSPTISIGNASSLNNGSYILTITLNGCSSTAGSASVSVSQPPIAASIHSNSPVCEGGSLQLFIAPVPGASYHWTGPNGFTSTDQNPVIPNVGLAGSGSYSVIVNRGQCNSLPATTAVVVNSIPASPPVNSNSPVCEGAGISLTAATLSGASYSWTGPNGFNSNVQNPFVNLASTANAGTYYLTATINGCKSVPSRLNLIVNALPPAPVILSNSPICEGSSLSINVTPISGAGFTWAGPNGFTAAASDVLINNAGISASGNYSVKADVNGCPGPAASITVLVKPTPTAPVLSSNQPVCEGSDLALTASSIAGGSFTWNGPSAFSANQQSPVIRSATTAAAGSYSAFVTVNGCSSTASTIPVIINPIPATPVISGNSKICEGALLSLSASTLFPAFYQWNGPNGFTATSPDIHISNTSPMNSGSYFVTASQNGCTSSAASANVLVSRPPIAPSINTNAPICTGTSLLLTTTALPGGSYSWTGPNGFTSADQNPVIDNVSLSNAGDYVLTVSLNGCVSPFPSVTTVVVRQTPLVPTVSNNGPVCEGSDLVLFAGTIPGAIYNWSGPGGFRSSLQNPALLSLTKSGGGNYSATVSINGCTSPADSTLVTVDQQASVDAGNAPAVCSSSSMVNLAGTISGSKNDVVWSTTGSGSFSNAQSLSTIYYPSSADKISGKVAVSLRSSNNGACPASSSSAVISFSSPPVADAGVDQTICANGSGAELFAQFTNAKGGAWSSSGTGSFQPSASSSKARYVPGQKDKGEGSVLLTWTTSGNGPCAATSDAVIISIKQPPTILTSGVFTIIENNSLVLKPVINGSHLVYSWTPAIFLNSDTIANPLCTPKSTVNYKLSVRDELGCTAFANLMVKLIRAPQIPNVFTPNGDGINDSWQVKNLADYADCQVDIYNRYGQLIFHSAGYAKDWDGSSGGKALPAGTYYYIIDLKTGTKPLSGFVDIVR